MTPFVRLIGASLFGCVFAAAAPHTARAEEPPPAAIAPDALPLPPEKFDPAALAESYFDESERFDAFLTYEVKRGPAGALFTIARRWRDGLAELLFDIREPASFDKWAMLMHQNRGASDDLFLYAGYATDLKVRRLAASQIERQALFELIALGDYRPTVRGELSYEAAPDETVDAVPCHVVIARTPASYLGFDRLELVFAAEQKLLLMQRFFRGSKEVRRLSTTLADYQDIGGRRLAMRWTARRWADGGQTEIVLKRVVETPDLPDRLFSHLNLKEQRFPEF
ncbi:MAG TPA: outer membrane lipoprotein-sorting protein [Myxococcota bacterium]|nr:outer membrane lipoprotein-sorting protein [Myxococcota bacterium]